jgi:inner membrane protein
MIVSDSKSIFDAVRESAFVKVMVVGFLMIVMLIPLGMIHGRIYERTTRRDDVVREVSRTWSDKQVAGGFILSVPYTVTSTNDYGKPITIERVARFLPETLAIDGRLVPEFRHRSLFAVPVYTAHLTMNGTFRRPNFAALRIDESTARFHDAWLTIGVGDLRGVNQGVTVTWNGTALATSPAIDIGGAGHQAMDVKIPGLAAAQPEILADRSSTDQPSRLAAPADAGANEIPFEVKIDLKGTQEISFQPGGRTTTVRLASTWPHPAFAGAFLPDKSRISDAGFDAEWRLSHLGRGYPQAWRDEDMRPEQVKNAAVASRFGVTLYSPVDIYHRAERSTKYGALFILLTFCTFFVIELSQRRRLHPVQYLLVGAALCLFYLLLLSLSEHIGFGFAYLAAAAGTIGVIGMYAGHVLGGLGQGVRMVAGLSLLYGFLYVLLQLEDYALLVGSISLFLILAAVMWATRRVDWYSIGRPESDVRV